MKKAPQVYDLATMALDQILNLVSFAITFANSLLLKFTNVPCCRSPESVYNFDSSPATDETKLSIQSVKLVLDSVAVAPSNTTIN